MHFEKVIDIDAPQQRVWDVVSDIEGWPPRTGTIESIEVLTPPPLGRGSRVRLKQPKFPEGVWDVTVWNAPAYFEWVQRNRGATTVAGHRVEALGEGRSRLTLTLEMRGLLISIVGRFYTGLTNDYMTREAEGMRRAAEAG